MQTRATLAADAVRQVLDNRAVRPGALFVVGCSTSEVVGAAIGKGSNAEVGAELADAILAELTGLGLYLCAQCCEHLNRALVVEHAAAAAHRLEPVSAVPHDHAGGAFATAVFARMQHPVLVEAVRADFGLDIGQTMIGMHMRPVAVPVRIAPGHIGQAAVTGAYARPKLIGGERARYE